MDQLLTKVTAITENTDPRGVKWGICAIKGSSLYSIDVVEGNKLTGKPESLQGLFTNKILAQRAISNFLSAYWDESDLAAKKMGRKQHAESVSDNS